MVFCVGSWLVSKQATDSLSKRVLSPELQECNSVWTNRRERYYGRTRRRKPQNPQCPKVWGSVSRGRTTSTSATIRFEQIGGARNRVRDRRARLPARESWRPSSAPRDLALAHRSLHAHSAQAHSKQKRPTDHPITPSGIRCHLEGIRRTSHQYSVRNPGDRTVARTVEMISEIHYLGDYLGEFW